MEPQSIQVAGHQDLGPEATKQLDLGTKPLSPLHLTCLSVSLLNTQVNFRPQISKQDRKRVHFPQTF